MPSGGKTAATQLQEKNPVLQLNDLRKDCVYELVSDDSVPEKHFKFKLTIDGKSFEGIGPSKKTAKAAVATKALKHPAVNVNAGLFKAQQKQINANQYQIRQQQKQQQQQFSAQKKQGNFGQRQGVFNQNKRGQSQNNLGMMTNNRAFKNEKQVCRYFLNGVCIRGKNCPNYHPDFLNRSEQIHPASSQVPSSDSYNWLQFCQNYVHLRCPRSDCKFLHVSKDDEEVYLASGKIPAHVVEQAVRKAVIDDVAPQGVRQTCKAYLEGQCNWYSCPFRHVSRQEFSHEVLELLQKHFERKIRTRDDYRLISNRYVDRERFGYDARMLLEDSRLSDRRDHASRLIDSRDLRGAPLSGDDDWLVAGMQNLMRNNDYSTNKALEDLRGELRHLQEENERLRGSVLTKSMEEEKFNRMVASQDRGMSRGDRMKDDYMFQDQIKKLKDENDTIRRMLLTRDMDRQYPSHQLEHRFANPAMTNNRFSDMRSDMRRQNPETYNFDELLNSGINRREKQRLQQSLMNLPLNAVAQYQMQGNVGYQKAKGQKKSVAQKKITNTQVKKVFKMPAKKSGQIIQSAARPSLPVGSQKKKYLPANKKAKQQKQQQNKSNKQSNVKDKPIVTVTQQASQSKEQEENQSNGEGKGNQSKEQRVRRQRNPVGEACNGSVEHKSSIAKSSEETTNGGCTDANLEDDDDADVIEEGPTSSSDELQDNSDKSRTVEGSEEEEEEQDKTGMEQDKSSSNDKDVEEEEEEQDKTGMEQDKSSSNDKDVEEKSVSGGSERWVDATEEGF